MAGVAGIGGDRAQIGRRESDAYGAGTGVVGARRLAREEGMTFLRESALQKAREGVTTLKEINKVTFIEG